MTQSGLQNRANFHFASHSLLSPLLQELLILDSVSFGNAFAYFIFKRIPFTHNIIEGFDRTPRRITLLFSTTAFFCKYSKRKSATAGAQHLPDSKFIEFRSTLYEVSKEFLYFCSTSTKNYQLLLDPIETMPILSTTPTYYSQTRSFFREIETSRRPIPARWKQKAMFNFFFFSFFVCV